jgi:hypothetical protein
MFQRPTLRILAVLVVLYVMLGLPALVWPGYLDSPPGRLLAAPLLSAYLLHGLGVPGVLQHDGACGWGWCAPTAFGWTLVAVSWLMLAWLVARVIALWRDS